ncbi:hypothetical protein G6F50_012771 [Rhizopus delemar]|uniref:Uncharacterized protein n=1 Tax=Rhizopus delemar TaxID=936053 RepID=A0A9P6YQW7_9FUNG|nr:hypothetical protein G6F50_012771 [Rhizopus delemar]
MRSLLACSALLLLPLSALAADAPNCKFTAARTLKLDVGGARAVVFEVNQHDLKLVASKGGGQLDGRACASSQEWLDQLGLDQRKGGDKLVLRLAGYPRQRAGHPAAAAQARRRRRQRGERTVAQRGCRLR